MNSQEKTAVSTTAVKGKPYLEELSDILTHNSGQCDDNLSSDTVVVDSDFCKKVIELRRSKDMEKMKVSYGSPVQLIPAFTVKPKPISWLLPGLLARGMMTMLAGSAGIGKSYISDLFASIVSTGDVFDDHPVKQGRVLIWSGEDSPEYVLVPRLRALGANLDNIEFIGSEVYEYSERQQCGIIRSFDITTDLQLIEQTIMSWSYGDEPCPYSLLIIDPVMSVVLGDPHKASHVRQSLEPLRLLAERQNIAVLGITHFSKGSGNQDPQDRVIGSQAFTAVSRITLGLARDDETGIRRLVTLKSNITDRTQGYDFSYDFYKDDDGCEVAKIELVGKPQGDPRELMSEFEQVEPETGAVADAIEFLKDALKNAPLPVKKLKAESDGAGYSWDSIRRAAKRLGVEKRKDLGGNGIWRWGLPDN